MFASFLGFVGFASKVKTHIWYIGIALANGMTWYDMAIFEVLSIDIHSSFFHCVLGILVACSNDVFMYGRWGIASKSNVETFTAVKLNRNVW